MNKLTLSIVIGSASAVAGAIAGYFVAAKYLDTKYSAIYEEKLNTELSNIRKAQQNQEERRSKDFVSVSRDDLKDLGIVPSDGKPIEMTEIEYHKIRQEAMKPSEDKMYQKLDGDDEDVELDADGDPVDQSEVADEYWMDTPDFWDDKPATIISLDEYRDLPSYFDHVTFHYYAEDDTLVDDGDQIVDDITHVVGEALTKFGPEAAALADGDEDAVYVINGKMNLAIEVVRLNQSYASYMGMGE